MSSSFSNQFINNNGTIIGETAKYLFNNLSSYHDKIKNISYYAVSTGLNAYIITQNNIQLDTNIIEKKISLTNKKLVYQSKSEIICLKWIKIDDKIIFCVGRQDGILNVYDFSLKNVIFSFDANIKGQQITTINCITTTYKNDIIIGTSNGDIISLNLKNNKFSKNSKTIYSHISEINCVTNNDSSIFFGCNDGTIILYDSIKNKFSIILNSDNKKIPCTSLKANTNCLVSGFATGIIKIQEFADITKITEIAVHCRCLTALDLLPQHNLIATTSEDGYIHLLEIKWSDIKVINSYKYDNTCFVGIQFIPFIHLNIPPKVLVSSYDRKKIFVI